MINYSVYSRTTDGTTKYYASTQIVGTMSLDEFCQHIADHGSVYRKSDILGVLSVMVKCLKEQILNGKRIYVGDLGNYRAKATASGASSYSAVSSDNITKLTVNWVAGDVFDDMLDDATLNQVLTTEQASAVAAALADGSTSATLVESDEDEDSESV